MVNNITYDNSFNALRKLIFLPWQKIKKIRGAGQNFTAAGEKHRGSRRRRRNGTRTMQRHLEAVNTNDRNDVPQCDQYVAPEH